MFNVRVDTEVVLIGLPLNNELKSCIGVDKTAV